MSMRLGRRVLGALTAALVFTMPLAACSSGGENSGGKASDSAADLSNDIAQAAELNRAHEVDARFGDHPQVVASGTGSGVEASRTFFEAAEGVVVSSPDLPSQLRAASVAVATHAPLLVAVPGTEAEVGEEINRLGATTVYTVGDVYRLEKQNLSIIKDDPAAENLEKATGLKFNPKDIDAAQAVPAAIAALDAEQPDDLKANFELPAGAARPGGASGAEDSAGDEGGVGNSEGAPGDSSDDAADDGSGDIGREDRGDAARDEGNQEDNGAKDSQQPGGKDQGSAQGAESKNSDTSKESKASKDSKSSKKDSDKEAGKEHSMPVAPPRQDAPIVVATPETFVVEIANAKAYGAEVRIMDFPDPRVNEEAYKAVAGLQDQPLIALGAHFGPAERLSGAIELAGEKTAELPGGGKLVFPGRRMIALYGHPSGGALGVMGERSPEESVAYAKELVGQYQAAAPEEKVIPAFEIISTVASSDPGEDGDYSNEADPEELLPYIDAVTKAGGYAVIDLQPGRASLLSQAKLYEDLLKRPDVGLALDPEWKIGPDEQPLSRVGNVEAHEITEVADWLAGLVRDNKLPQKLFMVHQFQSQMIRDRETVDMSHAELAYVLHADGHGDPETKFGTWNVLLQDLSPVWFMAWKNFIDEDNPTFTPEQTMQITPKPWFVSYQ